MLQEALGNVVPKDAALCSDGLPAYTKFATRHGLSHVVLSNTPGKRKIAQSFHIQNLNALHARLKEFMRPFKGPASKYLDRHIDWYFVRSNSAPDGVLLGCWPDRPTS
ncbi:hypothetical protein [Roseivivax sp. CAU 1753]